MHKFVHLHTHSHYSLLNALPKIGDLIKTAKKDNMKALALTDSGNLYGAIEFYKDCIKAEIKPIIGVDFYVAERTRHDKEHRIDNKWTRLVLLAKNEIGYKNIIKLVTISHLEGFYYRPRIDKELIEKYSKGIIAIVPSFSGSIAVALRNSNKEKAKSEFIFFKSIYGEDLYLEITHHKEIRGHENLMKEIISFSRENKGKLIAAHDVYYINEEDKSARDTLVAIQKNVSLRQSGEDENADFSFITNEKAIELFKDENEALNNCAEIVNKCDLKIELGKWVFPKIEAPEGKTYDEELKRIVYEGFEKRNVEKTDEILKRVEYELEVIKNKGYSPYFLVVADLLKFARENKILSNIRGSVSGSMVTYLAGITNIDPIQYEIPFERFLNPDRPSAPDIDMDFADDRRDEVIEYTRKKYGEDKVAQIGTFGTMAARGSVRDVARALGYPYATGDKISKLIPIGSQGFPMTIERALEENEDFKTLYKKDKDTRRIVDMAKKIEGNARHISIHAAGVVISPSELTDFTPLQFDPKGENLSAGKQGKIITQYDMYSVEEAGLLKFDFLGLKNLSIIADTISLVKKLKDIEIDQDNIPIDDNKTFEMLARGETADLFQLNGDGMTKFLIDLKPTSIHDINAMVALYRPGPLQFIPEYIARKHNPQKISYPDPALEPILRKTNGILVYQDDLLMMAHKLAGYSWGELDKFRKAVGKKIPEEMAAQKEKFIKGCVEHSKWSEKKATEIWAWIEPFAAYGFNKAHSVSYGRIAYQTAYLKANFPSEYMASVLTHESGDVEKVAESVAECKRMGIDVLPPDVNFSFKEFTVIKKGEGKDVIRFGLGSIKNFGDGIALSIIEERKRNGNYKSLEDFLSRVIDKNLNKKSLESLIKAGAIDSLGKRDEMLGNLERLLEFNREILKNSHISDLFSHAGVEIEKIKLEKTEPISKEQILAWEKELLGLYLSGHPLENHKEKLASMGADIKKVKTSGKENMTVVISGIIESIKEIMTKKGDKMAFIKITDQNDSIETVAFPKTYNEFSEILKPDACIAIKGKISKRNDTVSIIIDKAKNL